MLRKSWSMQCFGFIQQIYQSSWLYGYNGAEYSSRKVIMTSEKHLRDRMRAQTLRDGKGIEVLCLAHNNLSAAGKSITDKTDRCGAMHWQIEAGVWAKAAFRRSNQRMSLSAGMGLGNTDGDQIRLIMCNILSAIIWNHRSQIRVRGDYMRIGGEIISKYLKHWPP